MQDQAATSVTSWMAGGAVVLAGVLLLALALWGMGRISYAPADREGAWSTVVPTLLPGLLVFVITSSVGLAMLAFFLTWGLVDRTAQPAQRPGRTGRRMKPERGTHPRTGDGP